MGVIALDCDDLFATWRDQARVLLSHGIDPSEVTWSQGPMADLLAVPAAPPEGPGPFRAKVPAALLSQLEQASRYRGEQRWNLLYEVLWRVAHGDRTAMLAGDRLGSELQRRIKQVTREAHHLHAFVRFVPLPDELAEHLQLELVAYHEPAHDILHSASAHFADRLGRLRWLIATPQDGIRFDGQSFDYSDSAPSPGASGPAMPKTPAPNSGAPTTATPSTRPASTRTPCACTCLGGSGGICRKAC